LAKYILSKYKRETLSIAKCDSVIDKYPFLKKNVMVYKDKENSLLINPYRNYPQKLSRLNKDGLLLIQYLAGRNKTRDICHSLPAVRGVLGILKKWSSKEWNMVAFLDSPKGKAESEKIKNDKYSRISVMVRQELFSAQQAEGNNHLSMKEYHRKGIRNALQQFNDVEMTLSHLFREPHILLGGKNYGAAFADILMRNGAGKKRTSILEIGGGIGIFGKSFLDEIKRSAPKMYKNIKYTLFEISPTLLRSQRKILRVHKGVTEFIYGDIQDYDFRDSGYDLVISNEMIADLATVKLEKTDIKNYETITEDKKKAVSLIKEFGLDISDAPKEFLLNLGAMKLLKTLKRILKPSGKAYIVEYGSRWSYPRVAPLKGHKEYSIHFGLLLKAAKQLDLNPRIDNMADFLHFNKKIQIVNNVSWFNINNYLLPFLGRKKFSDAICCTRDMVKTKMRDIATYLSFIGFTRVGLNEMLMDPAGFLVLSLKQSDRNKRN
jgi:ubiquinone/menaquinone biosynthesis C-methylase UbiE